MTPELFFTIWTILVGTGSYAAGQAVLKFQQRRRLKQVVKRVTELASQYTAPKQENQ